MPEIKMTIDEILNIFVPGVICVFTYVALSNRKCGLQGYTLAGIVTGSIIKTVVDYVNTIALRYYQIQFPIFIVYSFVALLISIVAYKIKNSIKVRKLISRVFHLESGDSFWTNSIDWKNGTYVVVYTTDGNIVYGAVQSANDERITLLYYCTVKTLSELKEAVKNANTESVMCIPTKNIERFEIFYVKDTEFSQFAFQ